ncbi:MAG TPA: replicative DNA helicase, partial [Actinomycetales bacterium]
MGECVTVAELGVPSGPGESFDRTPPQDVAAEQSVLGGMMLSKDAIADVIEVLRSTDFYRPAHEMIFDAVLELYGRGEPADAVTVSDELTKKGSLTRVGGAPYLHTLISSVPTAANAGYYARIVRERAVLRRLVEAGTKIVQLGYATTGGDVDDIVNAAQAEVYAVTERRTSEDYLPIGQLIEPTVDEIEAAGHRGEGMIGVPTGFADLDRLTNGLHPGQMIVLAARPAIGKALALDTPMPTPTGWTTMGEVRVGDHVLGADGRPTRVRAATDVMLDRPCFEVTFSDGSVLVADRDHQWLTDTRASRRAARSAARPGATPAVRTTEEIARTLRCRTADRRLNHSVVTTRPLDLPDQDLLVPPYTLGAWLGDGSSDGAVLTSADPDIVLRLASDGVLATPTASPMRYSLQLPVEAVAERSCVVCGSAFTPQTSQVKSCGRSCGGRAKGIGGATQQPTCGRCGGRSSGFRLCQGCHDAVGTLRGRLRTIGVLGDKHVPAAYLRASERQRRDLLAGLLDTDGTVAPLGFVQFTSTRLTLANDVHELILSLGYRCSMSTRRVRGASEASSTAYTLTFSTDDQVFWLPRKQKAHKERGARQFTRRGSRFITAVTPVASVPVRCIEVDNDDHLYLAGESMIPTHNSTMGLDIARSASIRNKLTSVIFSLEMSRTEITMRMLSAEAKIPLQKLRQGRLEDSDWTKMARTMGELSDAPLFIDDSPNMSLMEIRAKCRRLKQRHDLKIVIIDYLQLMSSGKRVESRQQEVSEFSRALKLLAKELEVPVIAISQLNRGPEQRTDKKPQMSDLRESGCLTGDTKVLRADTGAEVTLGELYLSGATDVPVWSLDDSLRYVRRHLTHVFDTGVKPVFRLTLASGKQVRATANHPFLTYDGWRRLDELPVGSRLGVPRHVPAPELEASWTDDQVLLLAHLIGDGSFVRRQPIRYASIDEANLSAVAAAASREFGITAVRDEYPAARVTTLRLPAPYHLTHGRRNPIAAWLDGLGLFGLRSHEKFVPPDVFSLPKRQIRLFLSHLWSTDGSVTVRKNGRGGRVYYASTSRQLIDDTALLLLRFGISSRVRRTRKAGYRDGWTLDVSGAQDQKWFVEQIGVHGARGTQAAELCRILQTVVPNTNVDTVPSEVWNRVRDVLTERGMSHRAFAASMGAAFSGSAMWECAPSRERLGRVATLLEDEQLQVMAVNDLLWDEVVSIEPDGEEMVFDATVVGTHNFVAN